MYVYALHMATILNLRIDILIDLYILKTIKKLIMSFT